MIFPNSFSSRRPDSDILFISELKLSIPMDSLSSNNSSEYPMIVFNGSLMETSVSFARVTKVLWGSSKALSSKFFSIIERIS